MQSVTYYDVVCEECDDTHPKVTIEGIPDSYEDPEGYAYHQLLRSCSPSDIGDVEVMVNGEPA